MKSIVLSLSIISIGFVANTQVKLKKLSSPCDCLDQAIRYSEDLIKNVEKEKEAYIKQNLIDHYNVDKDLIVDYCDQKFNMNKEVRDCKDFDRLDVLMSKISVLEDQVESELEGTVFDNTIYEEEATEEFSREATELMEEDEINEALITDVMNPYEVAEDFCACAELEGKDKEECHKAWAEKYRESMNNSEATYEQGHVVGKRMAECDPENAMKALKMLESK